MEKKSGSDYEENEEEEIKVKYIKNEENKKEKIIEKSKKSKLDAENKENFKKKEPPKNRKKREDDAKNKKKTKPQAKKKQTKKKEDSDFEIDAASNDSENDGPKKSKKVIEQEKPKKEKKGKTNAPKEQVSKDDGIQIVLDYMKKQNRPYSIINIFDNLHGKIKKPDLQKILDKLSASEDLQAKDYGKSKVYLFNQKNFPEINREEMETLKNNLNSVKEEIKLLTDLQKKLANNLKEIKSELTNEEIENEISKFEKNIEESKNQLQFYESDKYEKISDEVMLETENNKKSYERKKVCNEMIASISESDEAGIEIPF